MKTKNSKLNSVMRSVIELTDDNTNQIKRGETIIARVYSWRYGTAVVLLVILFVILLTQFDINFNYGAH
ncbi:hypothetical protein [Lacinutrix sp. Hel_I_90]|uniref:hypothetical protein n=1 Tax=Lacinutrix sp. Hel_I_90 TaxID=1249999 RepID=UPI0005C99E59|nr:hypothetical protein [Lacinutrix sp. Hel_I_90]